MITSKESNTSSRTTSPLMPSANNSKHTTCSKSFSTSRRVIGQMVTVASLSNQTASESSKKVSDSQLNTPKLSDANDSPASLAFPKREVIQTTIDKTLVTNLRFAADAAAAIDAIVLVEPLNTFDVPGTFVSATSHGQRLVKDTVRDNVRLQFDVYHTQIMEGDLVRKFSRLLPIIGHVQIADTPGRHEPGSGEINYPFILDHIDSSGYEGWIGAEYNPAGDTRAGLSWAGPYL